MGRTPCCTKEGMKKGAWTAPEDKILTSYIKTHGEGKWGDLPTKAGLKRCGKSCRLRWLNYLRPDIKRGNISEQEEDLIIRLHKLLGNRWSLIAGRIPGRTDNEIKNYWNTILRKKVKGTTCTATSKSQSNQSYFSNELQTTTDSTKRQPLKTKNINTQVVQRTSAVRTKALKCTGMANRAQVNRPTGTTSTTSVSDHGSPKLVKDLEINSNVTNYTFDTLQGFDFDLDFGLDLWALCDVHDHFDASTGVDDHQGHDGKNDVNNDASDGCKWPSASYGRAILSSDQEMIGAEWIRFD